MVHCRNFYPLRFSWPFVALLVAAGVTWPSGQILAARGTLELNASDENGEPTAVRLRLRNSKGRPVFPAKLPRVGDAVVFDGRTVLNLPAGLYTFEAEKGPEYRIRSGHFVIQSGATDNHPIEMQRFVEMRGEGWWSGDLDVELPVRHVPLMMLAEDLHVANVVTWSNAKNSAKRPSPKETVQQVGNQRWLLLHGGRDRRPASDVILALSKSPLQLAPGDDEYPSPFAILDELQPADARIHLNRIDCWDLPVWVASRRLDSVGLLHPGIQMSSPVSDAVARPADPVLYPDPDGVGRWSQQIYFRLLDCGFRIPPAAGSGAGRTPNAAGFNRVYIHCGDDFSIESWWEGLRLGRVMLTNGPLLRPRANGQLPGHVFRARAGERVELVIEAQLATREKIDYLEVIKNGRSEVQVRLEDWAASGGQLPAIQFTESGWMLVRVVTTNAQTYRCATSGPFYVELDGKPRVDPAAAQFFLDWVLARARAVSLKDAAQRTEVMRYHRAARDFWQKRLDLAQ